MHPEDKLPPGEEHRGYYEQPVWKRIVVIGAGPAVNIALAFAILFVLALGASDPTQTVDEVVPGSPAATVLKPGDRILAIDGKSYPGADTETRLERFFEDVGSHECAGKPIEGCKAATPVTLRVERDGRVETISVSARVRRGGRADADRLLLRQRRRRTSASAAPRSGRGTRSGW